MATPCPGPTFLVHPCIQPTHLVLCLCLLAVDAAHEEELPGPLVGGVPPHLLLPLPLPKPLLRRHVLTVHLLVVLHDLRVAGGTLLDALDRK